MNAVAENLVPYLARQSTQKAAISVFGLGYVGAVSMACLSELGHEMVGVDVSEGKVEAINAGKSPIVEKDLDVLLRRGTFLDRISATTCADTAIQSTDISFVSVGTPTDKNGGCDMTFVRAVAQAIGRGLAKKSTYHLVVMRCSVPPGTTMDVMVPEIEATSGKTLGDGFGICFNPEFLREGTAVEDFFEPPKTVIGASDSKAFDMLAEVYNVVDENVLQTTIGAAEMVKYVDNVWHAAKVTFANEVGRMCKAIGVDSHEVMDVFVQDTKLNLSPYYLKPGFAFGGSCLPKEVRAMEHISEELGLDTPMMRSLMVSNRQQIIEALELVESVDAKKVGFLGVAFKPNTDDLRESPTLEVMAALKSAGTNISAYDPNLQLGESVRGHYEYMKHARPHLKDVMDELNEIASEDITEAILDCDAVVVSHATDQYREAVAALPGDVQVIDLARLYKEIPSTSSYHGLGW